MKTLFLLGWILTAAPAALAQAPAPPAAQDEPRYQVYLLTMDQGDAVWERFGHNALMIRDRAGGEELVWNWGLFDFDQPGFLVRFLRGTMRYSMGPADMGPFLGYYVQANRSVYANEVRLTQEEAAALDAFVRWNYLPENREYVYHYFLDNCSTRLRDALDGVLGGILHEAFAGRATPHSFRWHTRRLVQETRWIDQGLSFLLGMRGDPPRTEWEAMFLPVELMELLEGFSRADAEGTERPLLGPREVLFEAARAPAPPGPPPFSPIWAILGLGGGAALAGLARAGGRGAAERGEPGTAARVAGVAAAAGVVVWGVFSGALGALLVAAWFTDHDFIQWNLNVFHTSPLGLLVAAAVVAAGARGGLARFAAGTAIALAAISVGAALVQLTPLVSQGNGEVLAVALPLNVAAAVVVASRGRAAVGGVDRVGAVG